MQRVLAYPVRKSDKCCLVPIKRWHGYMFNTRLCTCICIYISWSKQWINALQLIQNGAVYCQESFEFPRTHWHWKYWPAPRLSQNCEIFPFTCFLRLFCYFCFFFNFLSDFLQKKNCKFWSTKSFSRNSTFLYAFYIKFAIFPNFKKIEIFSWKVQLFPLRKH